MKNIFNVTRIEINEHLAITEEKNQEELKRSQEDLMKTHEEMNMLNNKTAQMESNLMMQKDEKQMITQTAAVQGLEIHSSLQCGTNFDDLTITSRTISYTTLVYYSTNITITRVLQNPSQETLT